MINNIKVDPPEVNFGKVKFGQTYTMDYKVENQSKDNIRVENLKKSCTCTEVTAFHPEVAPGGVCTIKVDITPGSTGIFNRSFWFDVNGQSYHVSVKAQVE